MKLFILFMALIPSIAICGKIQDADVKSVSELVAAGATKASLINDTKIYVSANSINKTLNESITQGLIGAGSGNNIVKNYGAETGDTASWTNTGGTFSAQTGTILNGSYSFSFSASASSQSFQQSLTVPNEYYGQSGTVYFVYRYVDTGTNLTLQLIDGSSNVIYTKVLPVTTSTNNAYILDTFIFPSTTTMTLKIISTAATGAALISDSFTVGLTNAINASNITNAFAATKWTTTSGCTAGSSSFANCNISGADATRTNYGKATNQATANDIAIKIPSLPVGGYMVYVVGQLFNAYNSNNNDCVFGVTDGTTSLALTESYLTGAGRDNQSMLTGYFENATVADKTFTAILKQPSGNGTCAIYGPGSLSMMVVPVLPTMPMPKITNSVATQYATGVAQLNFVSIGNSTNVNTPCTTTTCTQYSVSSSGSGAWLTTVDRNSTGHYTLNIPAGVYTLPPVCTCSTSDTNGITCTVPSTSTSAVTIHTYNAAVSAADEAVRIICAGV